MAEQWATIEDDPMVIDAEIHELLENEIDDDNTTMNVDGGVNGDDGGGGNEESHTECGSFGCFDCTQLQYKLYGALNHITIMYVEL